MFNIVNTLVFIWFTGPIATLVEYLVPDKPLEEKRIIAPKYLDEELIETPSLALERTRLAGNALEHQAERLVAPEPGRLEAYSLEIVLIEKLKRVYYFAKRMANDVMPDELMDKVA